MKIYKLTQTMPYISQNLMQEAKKYKNPEEFKVRGFDAILKDLRDIKINNEIVVPTHKIDIIWKADYSNAKETARKNYNPKTAEPVELIYDLKSDRYQLDDGHNRFVAAQLTENPVKGIITKIEGNYEELANLYQKEKGITVQDVFAKAQKQ